MERLVDVDLESRLPVGGVFRRRLRARARVKGVVERLAVVARDDGGLRALEGALGAGELVGGVAVGLRGFRRVDRLLRLRGKDLEEAKA